MLGTHQASRVGRWDARAQRARFPRRGLKLGRSSRLGCLPRFNAVCNALADRELAAQRAGASPRRALTAADAV